MPAGIDIKSCTLEAFWAVRLKPGKISENVKIVENHRNSNQIMYSKSFLDGQAEAWESKRKLQNLIKSKETTQNHVSWMVSGRSGRNLEKWAKVERK